MLALVMDIHDKLKSQIGDDVQHIFDREALLKEAAAEIARLRAKVAKADALVEAFEDFNAKIDKARAPVGSARIAAIEALAAYRDDPEGEV